MATAAFTGTGSVNLTATYSYDADGAFLQDHQIGLREYKFNYIYAPSVNGAGTKSFGFRSQKIVLLAVYVASSENDVVSDFITDMGVLASQVSTLALAGQTFYGCTLEDFTFSQPKSTGLPSAKFWGEARIVVNSKRLS